VIAGAVTLSADDAPATKALLTDLAAGRAASVVLPTHGDLRATPADGGWRVSGSSCDILGACSAEAILIAADAGDGATLWFVVDPSGIGVSVEARQSTDLTVDVGIVRLGDYDVPESMVLKGIDDDTAWDVAVALTACAAAGTIRWCIDAVTKHLRTREQFGKPIGTFQALQHEAAMLLVNSELATAAAWDALRSIDEAPEQRQLAAAGAAIMAVSPAPELLLDALTLFGAIGFTWEHDMHLYWRRATGLAASMGPATRWSRRLGELGLGHVRDMSMKLGGGIGLPHAGRRRAGRGGHVAQRHAQPAGALRPPGHRAAALAHRRRWTDRAALAPTMGCRCDATAAADHRRRIRQTV
jgi:alkylation response protein AidB-like acyl-CoA dehydrogenase